MTFAGELNQFRVKFSTKSNELIQAVEIKLFSSVIMDSPVDTGRFRGNWMASIDGPKDGTTAGFDPTGAGSVSRAESFVKSLKGGRVTFLVNNLPYAIALEYGHSGQAPQGMVRRNVARFQRLVDEQARAHKL